MQTSHLPAVKDGSVDTACDLPGTANCDIPVATSFGDVRSHETCSLPSSSREKGTIIKDTSGNWSMSEIDVTTSMPQPSKSSTSLFLTDDVFKMPNRATKPTLRASQKVPGNLKKRLFTAPQGWKKSQRVVYSQKIQSSPPVLSITKDTSPFYVDQVEDTVNELEVICSGIYSQLENLNIQLCDNETQASMSGVSVVCSDNIPSTTPILTGSHMNFPDTKIRSSPKNMKLQGKRNLQNTVENNSSSLKCELDNPHCSSPEDRGIPRKTGNTSHSHRHTRKLFRQENIHLDFVVRDPMFDDIGTIVTQVDEMSVFPEGNPKLLVANDGCKNFYQFETKDRVDSNSSHTSGTGKTCVSKGPACRNKKEVIPLEKTGGIEKRKKRQSQTVATALCSEAKKARSGVDERPGSSKRQAGFQASSQALLKTGCVDNTNPSLINRKEMHGTDHYEIDCWYADNGLEGTTKYTHGEGHFSQDAQGFIYSGSSSKVLANTVSQGSLTADADFHEDNAIQIPLNGPKNRFNDGNLMEYEVDESSLGHRTVAECSQNGNISVGCLPQRQGFLISESDKCENSGPLPLVDSTVHALSSDTSIKGYNVGSGGHLNKIVTGDDIFHIKNTQKFSYSSCDNDKALPQYGLQTMGVADPLNEILHSNELGNTAVQNGAGIKSPKEKDNDKLKGGGDGASGSEGSVDPPDTTLSAFVKSTFEGDTSGNFYDSDHEDVLSICASMSDGFCSDLELDKDDQRDYHKLLGSDELAKHSGGKEREPVQSNVCLDQQAMQTNSYQENASHLGSERYRLCVSEGEYTIVSMTKHLSVKVGGVSSVDTPCVPGAVMGLEKTGHINSGKESKENGVLADSSSPSHCLLMKQPEQACVEEKTYSRQRNQDWEASKPQGSSCLEDQKKGFDKFFPKPRMGNSKYCCFFANNGVCFRPTCHYKHQMSLEVENYVGHLVLHYLTARKAQKAWELIDIHTRNCPDIPLLPIFLLVPLARHIVEESQQLKLTNNKVPAHLTSPLDIAKVCALCETCRGSEAYQLLRSCYGNASVIGVQRLIGTFIRYCESWPEEEAESPWEKVLLWMYEEEGHPGGDKIKEMFDIGWLMVNIGCRKINRVCEVYGYLSSRLSAPSSFFTSITCSVITFLNDTGNRKMSFHVLKEVRRLRANDSSIFIALIPTDKESAMAVLPELSEMGNLVCELLVPLPTCSWDLLLTLIMSTRNLTLSISLLICAMKINSYKPDIGVLEELLLDCSQGGSLLMHSLSIVICGLSAEYLMRLRPTLHSLINLLAGAPPPAPQATDNIIRHCQAQGINLQPHAKVSPNVMQKKGVFSNNAEKRVCPLVEMHHKKSSLLTSGNLSRGRGRQTVQVVSDMSFGYQNDQSLENSRSAVKLGYHSDYIESNRKPLLGPGSGCNDSYDAEKKNLKAYYNYSSGSYKNYIPPSNSTEYRWSKNCRDIAFGMRYSDSHMRESRTLIDFSYQCNVSSSVGPYRHQTSSTGPGSQAQPISSSALDYQSQPISLSGSDFQNWTTPSTCFDHYQTMSASLSSDHNWPHMVSVRYKNRPSAVIGNSLENLGDNTQGYRQGVRNIRTGEFNEQRQNRKGHDIPQYPQPECHGQTSTRGDYFKSVSEFCRRSPLVDATVVAPRHPSAPSNSMSLASGSCSNTYKQEELVGRVANGISTVEAGEKTDNMELTQHQQTQLFIPLSSEVTEGVGSEPVKDTTPRGSCINQSVINNVHMLKRKPKPDNNNNNNNNNTVSLKRKHEEPCYPRKESKTSSELSSCSRGKLDQLDQRKEQADMCCMSQPSISLTSGHKMLQSEEIHKSLPYLDSNSEHSQGYYSVRPKQLGVIQGSNFSQMGVEQRLTEELRPPVSHTSSSTLPHYLKIDIAGHSFSPNNYRTNYRQFEEWMGEFDVNSRESLITTVSLIQNMIAGSHSLSQRRLQLMQIVTMLTEGDAIYSVGKKVAAILKFFIGSRNWRRRPISDAEREWIGQLGVTIFVKCIKRNILTEAASVINTLHNRNIFFYSHTPITDTRYEHFSDQRLALMALEVLSRVHNFEVFNQILDEVYWSGGTGDIKIRLRIIAKVLDTLFEALTTGAYKVREKTLRWMTKILVSLAKYYHHDYHIIKLDYHKILDLPNILIRSWEEAQECGNPKLSSQLSSVICSSMASGVHLPHAFALNFELLRIKKTHAASTASRNRRMSDLPHQKWTNTYWLTLKGPEEGGRSDPGAPSYSKTHTSTLEETRSVHIESRFIKPQINVSDTRNEMIPLGRSAYGDGSGKTHLPTIRSEMEKKTRKDLVLPGCDESFLNKKMGALGGAQVPRNRNGRWSTPKVKHKLKGSKRPLMCRHTLE